MAQEIYADYNATYPLSSSHLKKVSDLLTQNACGNPSSIHSTGRRAKRLLEEARAQIAELLGASYQDLFFTSGATEANNMLVQGLFSSAKIKNLKTRPHVLTTAAEHPSLLNPLEDLHARGLCELEKLELQSSGKVAPTELLEKLREETVLIALSHVNGEIGSIQDVKALCQILERTSFRPHFHLDGAQAFAKLNCEFLASSLITSYSASAHKTGAFSGCGFLYLKNSQKNFLKPSMLGGGQEKGLRPGTENLPGIVSFAIKAKEFKDKDQSQKVAELRKNCVDFAKALAKLPGLKLNSKPQEGLATTVNLFIEGINRELIILELEKYKISVATGSACSSGSPMPSPSLQAIKASDWACSNSIRLSFGELSSKAELMMIYQAIKGLLDKA